jgi:hypothetical protein
MRRAVEGVLIMEVWGFLQNAQSGGRSSDYGRMGVPIECTDRTAEGVNLCPCTEQKQGRPGWLPQSPYQDNRSWD